MYKNMYPIFSKYWYQKTGGYTDILVYKRIESKWEFIKYFIYILSVHRNFVWGHKTFYVGWYLTIHDRFIGTRVLYDA